MAERCMICRCHLYRTKNTYARPTGAGRSHVTEHHVVAERFLGRSGNRKGTNTTGVFASCPWDHEGRPGVFCYERHEELLLSQSQRAAEGLGVVVEAVERRAPEGFTGAFIAPGLVGA